MKRNCSECPGCLLIQTVQGRSMHICVDEEGGAFLQEVGLLGYCDHPAEVLSCEFVAEFISDHSEDLNYSANDVAGICGTVSLLSFVRDKLVERLTEDELSAEDVMGMQPQAAFPVIDEAVEEYINE